MNKFSALFAVVCVSVVVPFGHLRALEPAWTYYRNERLGFVLPYPPSHFRLDRSTEAGDGQLLVSKDGRAQILVGGFKNSERHTPASYQRYIARHSYPDSKVDYAPIGDGWSVLSGARDRTMFYEKAFFTCGGRLIVSFALTYPVAERKIYDPIVEQIEDNFRPWNSACG